ncbi:MULTISPECIES: DUF58 domain-containing protein [Microbacterium]|uniref:DUF58 domain-containing protein n=1 Tax=Microbacterium wangchenii TaxID=2541726 RepID=A0ABX5SR75_9MICO|nr:MULTISPECIES: DUF58 domain-containing protein [Microbacterium]MCK6066413.1 DUF58 domain-containing protein [Microbacterium sp. EYE_512]QBR87379.1 DUF58 domain-containing protein [Microbacterium wangchenii]TXK14701.1 DUF58 domain-containing protein [Microbacterium wangchenii]
MTSETLGTTVPAGTTRTEALRQLAAPLAARVLRGTREVLSVVRPLGWVVFVTAVVLWITGQMLGWHELIVAALVLTAVLVICAGFLIGRTDYDVGLDLTRTRVVVGERAVGALTLANTGSRAILPSRVVLPVGAGRGEFAVKRLAPGEEAEELFAIPTNRRAVLAVGPVSVVRGDPLGVFERVHRRDEPVDLYVHPRTVLFDGQSLGFLRDLEGLPATDLSRDDISFHALREYQPGDDRRNVHWRSTARTGTLMVRQFEETRRSHFVIGLSRNPGDYADADEFELAISAAGSLGLRALRDSQRVEVRVQGAELPSGTGKQFLDGLSGLSYARGRTGDIVDLAGHISATAPAASVVVLLCGSAVNAARLRVACGRVPFGARALVVVADTTVDAPSLRRIADADVLSLGALDQLPSALARVLA